MPKTNENTESNHSIRPNSKLSRIRLTLIATTIFCGLVVSGVSGYSQAQAITNEAATDHSGWIRIPGALVRSDCVHEVPTGAMVEMSDDNEITGNVTLNGEVIAHYEPCSEKPVITGTRKRSAASANASGTGNGPVEDSQWDLPLAANDNIDYLGNTWTVPAYPSTGGALIYLYNAIAPESGDWILQPVLQYGESGVGGGNYYTISSWLIGANGYAFYSPLVEVNPGDTILGHTGLNEVSGSTFYFMTEAKDETTGRYSWIKTHISHEHWTWAFAGVLEVYGLSTCSQLPSSNELTFRNAVVDHGFPYYNNIKGDGWVGAIYSYGGPSCGFMVHASQNSTLLWSTVIF
jgi:hypothetical protein